MLKYKVRYASINVDRFQAQLLLNLSTVRKKAVIAYIKRLIRSETDGIPIWSGAARATLIPLGRLANFVINITPRVQRSDDEHGISAGRAKARAAKFVTSGAARVEFSWYHSLWHYWFHEGSRGGNWKTIQKGLAAIDKVAKTSGFINTVSEEDRRVYVLSPSSANALKVLPPLGAYMTYRRRTIR